MDFNTFFNIQLSVITFQARIIFYAEDYVEQIIATGNNLIGDDVFFCSIRTKEEKYVSNFDDERKDKTWHISSYFFTEIQRVDRCVKQLICERKDFLDIFIPTAHFIFLFA